MAVVFLLGYAENPADEKFDPPGSQVINKPAVKSDSAEEMAGLEESWPDQPETVPDFERLAAEMENSIRQNGRDGD
jgi:hypothetical protein